MNRDLRKRKEGERTKGGRESTEQGDEESWENRQGRKGEAERDAVG